MALLEPRLYHHLILDDELQGEVAVDAGTALARLAATIGAELKVKLVRDEPRYFLRKRDDPFELMLQAGHLYDTREALSMALELRCGERLLLTCGCPSGLERIKLGENSAWLRTLSGLTIVLGPGPGGLVEIQD